MDFFQYQSIVELIVTGGFGGFFGWLFTRRKYRAETGTTEIGNAKEVIGTYKESLDDLGNRYETKYRELEARAQELVRFFNDREKSMQQLYEDKEKVMLQEIAVHKKNAELYRKMYTDKVKEFNEYRKSKS